METKILTFESIIDLITVVLRWYQKNSSLRFTFLFLIKGLKYNRNFLPENHFGNNKIIMYTIM